MDGERYWKTCCMYLMLNLFAKLAIFLISFCKTTLYRICCEILARINSEFIQPVVLVQNVIYPPACGQISLIAMEQRIQYPVVIMEIRYLLRYRNVPHQFVPFVRYNNDYQQNSCWVLYGYSHSIMGRTIICRTSAFWKHNFQLTLLKRYYDAVIFDE